jgi:hypothetical protein
MAALMLDEPEVLGLLALLLLRHSRRAATPNRPPATENPCPWPRTDAERCYLTCRRSEAMAHG